VSLLEELFSGISQQKNVSVVEWVSDLESIDYVSISLFDEFMDFLG